MARGRILVVDDSPAMRETLCVLLGDRFDVCAVAATQLSDVPDLGGAWNLTIAAPAAVGAAPLPACPVIWLGGEGNEALPRRFTPTELRRRIADAMRAGGAQPPGETAHPWWLREPFLDGASCRILERARATRLALHVAGEAGSGKHAVARSVLPGDQVAVCDAAHPVPPPSGRGPKPALLAIGVDRWRKAAQRALDDYLTRFPAIAVVSTATRDLEELRDTGAFLSDLYYRLTLLSVRLLPLRDRPDDIPAIAKSIAADVAQRLGRPVPAFTPAAESRLAHYLWFGNVAELQAVLTRTLALAAGSHIDAGDLRFDGAAPLMVGAPRASAAPPREVREPATPPPPAAPAEPPAETASPATAPAAGPAAEQAAALPAEAPAPGDAADDVEARIDALAATALNGAAAGPLGEPRVEPASPPAEPAQPAAGHAESAREAGLDMIIHELAHEFKNPLVAIKSYAQHQQRVLPDADPDEIRFAQVTEEAAQQMDQVLENLLTFTRMTEPRPQVVALDRLLAPLFGNGNGARFDYIAPPPVLVRVDPEQVSYAIDNLLRALLRDATPGVRMNAQFCAPDALLCQLPAAASASDKLRELTGEESAADQMPLGIALANALLERNGAELRMTREGDPKTVMIRFPLAENEDEEVEARNGTSPRIGR